MVATEVRQYYSDHSTLTDPGVLAPLYADLPGDIRGLARVVQGVLIHPGPATLRLYQVKPAEIDNTLFGLRHIEALLRRIQQRHGASLAISRPPALRIGANCRNFGVLLVSMLRQQGVPAPRRLWRLFLQSALV